MKKYILLLFVASLIFSSCKKDNSIDELSMIIEGSVFDEETTEPIENATISITTQGVTYTDTTDANGSFYLGEFVTGTYNVTVKKAGYISEKIYASSSTTAVNQSTEQTVFNQEVNMTPLNQSISLSVFKYFDETTDINTRAAANVEYELYYEGISENLTGKTSSTGLLSVDSLPFNTTVYFYFDFEEDDIIYKDEFSFNTLYSVSSFTIYGYESTGQLAVVSSNLLTSSGIAVDNFNNNTAAYIIFNQPVDTASAFIYIKRNSDTYDEIEWSQNNKKATIIYDSLANSGASYYFQYSAYNTTNAQFIYNYFYFTTADE